MSGAGKVVVTQACETCANLTDENEMVVARLAARMGCAFVCKECGREAQDTRHAEAAQLDALREAREALAVAVNRLQYASVTYMAEGKTAAAYKFEDWENEARQALASLTAAMEKVTP